MKWKNIQKEPLNSSEVTVHCEDCLSLLHLVILFINYWILMQSCISIYFMLCEKNKKTYPWEPQRPIIITFKTLFYEKALKCCSYFLILKRLWKFKTSWQVINTKSFCPHWDTTYTNNLIIKKQMWIISLKKIKTDHASGMLTLCN